MSEFTRITGRWLWRFFPVIWLDWIIVRGLNWAFALLEDEESRDWLWEDMSNCAWLGGWLAVIDQRINELIVYKAMGRLRRPFRGRKPCLSPARAVVTPHDAFRRLTFLFVRYYAIDRLVARRTCQLKRLFDRTRFQLEIIPHPLQAQPSSAAVSTGLAPARVLARLVAYLFLPHAPHPAGRIRAPP